MKKDLEIAIQALKNICNPIKHMKEALKDGEVINGIMAYQLANDPNYLKGIAEGALKLINRE